MEIENGLITDTMLGHEDHGIFTCMIHMKFDGTGQGYGGYGFDTYNDKTKTRVGTKYGCQCIISLLKTIGVDKWEDLVNTHIRVKRDKSFGEITYIGHIIKDQWFSFKDISEEMRNNE